MVVIASDHPRLKVSWRGEPLVAGLLGTKTRVVAMNRLESGCFFKQWTRCVLTCFDHLGWRFQAGICQSMRSLSAKGEATSSKYHGSPFFLHNHNESHRITMNHNESHRITMNHNESHRITMNHSRFLEDLLLVLEDGKIGSMGSYEELQRSSATLKASLWSLWRFGRGPWKVRKTRDPQNCWIWVINIIYWLVLNDSEWCWMILNDVEWY